MITMKQNKPAEIRRLVLFVVVNNVETAFTKLAQKLVKMNVLIMFKSFWKETWINDSFISCSDFFMMMDGLFIVIFRKVEL